MVFGKATMSTSTIDRIHGTMGWSLLGMELQEHVFSSLVKCSGVLSPLEITVAIAGIKCLRTNNAIYLSPMWKFVNALIYRMASSTLS